MIHLVFKLSVHVIRALYERLKIQCHAYDVRCEWEDEQAIGEVLSPSCKDFFENKNCVTAGNRL